MTGRHMYNAMAAKLNAVHTAYHICSKAIMIVTNNACNFVQAFKEFVCDDSAGDNVWVWVVS